MKRFFAFLLWIFIAICPAIAADLGNAVDIYYPETITCASTGQYQKCAKLPDLAYNEHATASGNEEYANITTGTAVDDIKWTHFRNGVSVAGYAENVSVEEWSMGRLKLYQTLADCVVTEPFSLVFSVITKRGTSIYSGAEACIEEANTSDLGGVIPSEVPITVAATAPDGDTCPDGFFTVPWESWCGDGMVNVADVPNCDDDTSGEYCLINSGPTAVPCAAGITVLQVGASVSIPLWAEKYTEPAMGVMYNNTVCWANAEPGQATNTINVMYNNQVYHLVD